MRPGVKTTEFWLSLVAMALVNLPQIYTDERWALTAGLVGTALVAMGYGVSRARAKSTESEGELELTAQALEETTEALEGAIVTIEDERRSRMLEALAEKNRNDDLDKN